MRITSQFEAIRAEQRVTPSKEVSAFSLLKIESKELAITACSPDKFNPEPEDLCS